jgi:regulator of protease activity HflC (stomatin/prohibitin superfamily)
MKLFDGNISWEERTGLSFKSLWCVNRALHLLPWMTLAGCGILLLSTSLYVVEPHQEGLLYRLGALRQTYSVKRPGLYFKLPWPVDRVDIYDVSRVRNMQIGYLPSSSRDYLWNSSHGGQEYALLLGGGNEMIAVNLRVSYRIRDLYGYATRCANPEDLLSSKVYELMMQKTMSSDLNTMLSVDRKGLSEALTEELSEYASELGLHVNEVIIESIHPPIDLTDVYHGVVGASIQKETLIARAEADAEKTRNIALQEKERTILAAAAQQIERTSLARRDMAVYENAFLASEISPECYKLRKTTDAYQRVIQGGRAYVFSPDTAKGAHRYLITNGLSPILMNQEF